MPWYACQQGRYQLETKKEVAKKQPKVKVFVIDEHF